MLVYRMRLECVILGRGGLFTLRCPLAKLALLIGPIYWFGPIDLIPNRLPYIGYLDQVTFVLAGVALARLGVPQMRATVIRARRPPPCLLKPFTLVFCHCPKTAGTSLFRALSDRLGYRASYLMRRTKPDLAHLQARGFALVSGHAPYGHYRDAGAVNANTRFITFVRDPRAVLLSRFAHVLRNRRDFSGARHFFEVELASRGIGMTTPEALHLFLAHHRRFDASDADNPQTRFAANYFVGPLEEHHFEEAKANLAAMEMVGCTERFDESLQLLAYRLGWRDLSHTRLNVSEAGQRVATVPGLEAELDCHLAFDRRLVAWAQARFAADHAAMQAECAARGEVPPIVTLLDAPPPYRAVRHRIGAATTLLLDDWLWWLGARWTALRQRQRRQPAATPSPPLAGRRA